MSITRTFTHRRPSLDEPFFDEYALSEFNIKQFQNEADLIASGDITLVSETSSDNLTRTYHAIINTKNGYEAYKERWERERYEENNFKVYKRFMFPESRHRFIVSYSPAECESMWNNNITPDDSYFSPPGSKI